MRRHLEMLAYGTAIVNVDYRPPPRRFGPKAPDAVIWATGEFPKATERKKGTMLPQGKS